MKCEAAIRPKWYHGTDDKCCSYQATHLVYGVPMCSKHAADRAGAVALNYAVLVKALREIAHGTSGSGARTDVAVMQTIARRALGELGT